MRKLIVSLAFFAITLSASAQSFNTEIANEDSKILVEKLVVQSEISIEQQKAVYRVSMLKLRKMASAKNKEEKTEVNNLFQENLQTILKPSQYKKYLSLKK